MLEALLATDALECLVAVGNSTAVAPDDGWTERLAFLIHTHETMHLIRDTDSLHVSQRTTSLLSHTSCCLLEFVPPHFGFLLCPSGLLCND